MKKWEEAERENREHLRELFDQEKALVKAWPKYVTESINTSNITAGAITTEQIASAKPSSPKPRHWMPSHTAPKGASDGDMYYNMNENMMYVQKEGRWIATAIPDEGIAVQSSVSVLEIEICPRCEAMQVLEGDYLCSRCRYGS